MSISVAITGFPMPPSVNALYAHVSGRTVKTRVYRDYEQAVYHWMISNGPQVDACRALVKSLDGKVLHVDAMFYMLRKSILCLNGKPKRNDTSNRLKALHDVLGSIVLLIDDSYFWAGSFSKQICETKAYVDINFKTCNVEGPEYVEAGKAV